MTFRGRGALPWRPRWPSREEDPFMKRVRYKTVLLLSLLSLPHPLSRSWNFHQKAASCQCCPASTAEDGTRRAAAFVPSCPRLSSHPVGRLVTLSAAPSLDRLATQPPGYGASPTHFATSLHAFITSLACSASALASDVAATACTQCATIHRPTCRDNRLWALTRVCPDPGFASRLS